jgi:hypothetical protein
MSPIEERKSRTSSVARKLLYTGGEVFSDSSAIELLKASSGENLALLYWKDSRVSLGSHIDIGDFRYVPLSLDATIRHAIRLPRIAAKSINSNVLLSNLAKLFEIYVGYRPAESPLLAAWVVSTWFPEYWLRTPDLAITGLNMDMAMVLLRLLSCLTRHSLLLTGVERTNLRSLPMQCCPTLLINQRSMSSSTLELLRSSNYCDLVLPGKHGSVWRTAGSKALFLGANGLETDGLRISLPPAQCRNALLSIPECQRIAEKFQPQMLRYRLEYLSRFRSSQSSAKVSTLSDGLLLAECIQDDAEFKDRVTAIAAARDEEARAEQSRKPEVATVEALWAPSHNSKELKIKDITKLVNTLIRTRGETLEYNEVEIGLMLRNIGFPRHRNGSGMVLRFSAENCKRLHELAQDFGLILKNIPGCAICELGS